MLAPVRATVARTMKATPPMNSTTTAPAPRRCPVCGNLIGALWKPGTGGTPCSECGRLSWFRIQEIDDAVLINLLPSLDLEYSDIATIFESLIQRRLGVHVVVNLSLVQYIGSTFLGHLIAAKQKVTASNGRFILCGFNPVVEEIFRVTRLDGFFEIADVEAVVPKGA
jgi:anti-anti-sigma factor